MKNGRKRAIVQGGKKIDFSADEMKKRTMRMRTYIFVKVFGVFEIPVEVRSEGHACDLISEKMISI